MPYQHGTSRKFVTRQITLTTQLEDALKVLAARSGKSPSEIVRVILARDAGVAKLLNASLLESAT